MSVVLEASAPARGAVTFDEMNMAADIVARMKAKIAELEAENERLRAALSQQISFMGDASDWDAPGMELYDDYDNALAALRAREAEEAHLAGEAFHAAATR